MTLNQALTIIKERRRGERAEACFLVCGCQPLHLATLLQAHILERRADVRVEILTGLYGDFAGNLEKAANSPAAAAAVALEWSDIDQRLGLRSGGGWSKESKKDILAACRERCAYFAGAIRTLAARMPVAVAGPSLPLPPIGHTARVQASLLELDLERQMSAFLLDLSQISGVRIVHRSRMDQLAAGVARLDAKMELLAGFPYTVSYANVLACCLAGALYQRAPKKGLITDLDETLWSGIAGEVGADAVSWHQERHTQSYGLYQQMLGHLADCGVLLGVCSKNEPSVVQAALAREDLFLDHETLFPVYANWGPKSASVAGILQAWNIGEDAVVFIDDNPMELSEVQQAFPGMTCLQFPGNDAARVWDFLGELRDLFGKPLVTEEDGLRRASLRAAGSMRELGETAGSSAFLRGLQGAVTVDYRKNPSDRRPLELINKTNQFNLNGLRMGEDEWLRRVEEHDTILAVVSYQDKLGPLGKIAVLVGAQTGDCVRVSHWVMSCRAFSRRIEHHTLDSFFRETNAAQIEFAFQATERNAPLQEFFRSIGVRNDGIGAYRLSRSEFLSRCGVLPHEVSALIQ